MVSGLNEILIALTGLLSVIYEKDKDKRIHDNDVKQLELLQIKLQLLSMIDDNDNIDSIKKLYEQYSELGGNGYVQLEVENYIIKKGGVNHECNKND